MNNSFLVSVIIPTYNRQKVWEEEITPNGKNLLSNLLFQTYKNIEIIIVIDGATDNTYELLKKFQKKDSRIRIIYKDNGGAGSARNEGIKHSKGEYIFFIDDDDNVPRDYIESFMLRYNDGCDLIIDSYSHYKNDIFQYNTNFNPQIFDNTNTFLIHLFKNLVYGSYIFFLHGKRFKRSIIENHSLKFKDERTITEDRCFILDYIQFSNSFKITNDHKYQITEVNALDYKLSATNRPIEKWWIVFKNSYIHLIEYSKIHPFIETEIKIYAYNYLLNKTLEYIIIPFNKIYSAETEYLSQSIIPYLKKNLKISSIKNKKYLLFYILIVTLGIKNSLKLLHRLGY